MEGMDLLVFEPLTNYQEVVRVGQHRSSDTSDTQLPTFEILFEEREVRGLVRWSIAVFHQLDISICNFLLF